MLRNEPRIFCSVVCFLISVYLLLIGQSEVESEGKIGIEKDTCSKPLPLVKIPPCRRAPGAGTQNLVHGHISTGCIIAWPLESTVLSMQIISLTCET